MVEVTKAEHHTQKPSEKPTYILHMAFYTILQNRIYDAVFFRFSRVHKEIAVNITLDL